MKKASKQKEAEDYRFAWYSDVVDRAVKMHPGLTREEAQEMLDAFGF